jgi:hypothetical protein
MAFEGLEIPTHVKRDSLERAKQGAQFAARVAVMSLLKQTGKENISSQVVEEFQRLIHDRTLATRLAEREAGLFNDSRSKVPGLTALIRLGAKTQVQSILKGKLEKGEPTAAFKEINKTKDGLPLYTMHLTHGGYRAEPDTSALWFWDIVEPLGTDQIQAVSETTLFFIPTEKVITIIGNGGEYWQNPQLNRDGVIKFSNEF